METNNNQKINKRAYYWIKLHTSYLSDSRFMMLSPTIKYHYFALYLLACEGDSGGVLVQNGNSQSTKHLAFLLHEEENVLQESLDNLIETGFIEVLDNNIYAITRFMDEQGKASFGDEIDKKREQWREQKARYRSKQNKDSDSNKDKDKDIEVLEMSKLDISRTKNTDFSPSADENQNPTPSYKKAYPKMKTLLEKDLGVNMVDKEWDDFIYFAYKQEVKKTGSISHFIKWFKQQEYNIIYFPPRKLISIWPQAFIDRNQPDPNFINEPESKPESKDILSDEEAVKRLRAMKSGVKKQPDASSPENEQETRALIAQLNKEDESTKIS